MKKTTKAGLAVAAVAAVATSAMVISAFGPENRKTYTMESPADKVTFNSITNNPTQFLSAQLTLKIVRTLVLLVMSVTSSVLLNTLATLPRTLGAIRLRLKMVKNMLFVCMFTTTQLLILTS